MSVSESKRHEVFHRAGGRCQCTLAQCSHPIDRYVELQRASGTIAVGPIGAALLSSADRLTATPSKRRRHLRGELWTPW